MTYVTGQVVPVKDDVWGTTCDDHSDREAVKRICSEADSFGAEYMNFCQECWDDYQQGLKEKEEDPEQWDTCPECNTKAPRLISYRDMDEGMHGPVYEHCGDCHSKMNERIAEEDGFYDNDDGYDDCFEPEYEREPHYEDLTKDELQHIADYLKREYHLPFVIREHGKDKGQPNLSLAIEIKGSKAYHRMNARFIHFVEMGIDNNLIDIAELKQEMCGSADDIEVIILNHRITDRKIEGHKRAPNLSMGELVKLAESKKRIKPKLAKEHITPVYRIELMLCKVYWS